MSSASRPSEPGPEGPEPTEPADTEAAAEPRATAPETGVSADDRPPKRLVMLGAITVTVVVLDVLTKTVMVATLRDGERIPLLGDLVSFTLIRNSGAAFSFATGLTWVLTLVALAVVLGIVRYARNLRSPGWALALGLVLGGALGNLIDRFFRGPGPMQGHVVDFVSVGWFPVFNVADSAITVGGVTLVLLALMGRDLDGTRAGGDEPAAPAEPTEAR